MKRILLLSLCVTLAMASFTWNVDAAGTSNPKMNFMNVEDGAYYNLLDKNAGFQLERGTAGGLETDDALGNVITAQRPASSTDSRSPRISHYWAYTPKANAAYLAFMYQYTGKNAASRMTYQYTDATSSNTTAELIGDGQWRIGVFDFSELLPTVSAAYIQYYIHDYFIDSDLYYTQFKGASYNIFQHDPRITQVNFDIAPVTGEAPAAPNDIVLGEDENFVINDIVWYDRDGSALEGAFEKEAVYKAEISMTANENYTFDADADWSLPNANRVTVKAADHRLYQNTIVLEAEFDTMGLQIAETGIADGQTEVGVVGTELAVRFNKQIDGQTLYLDGAVSVEPAVPFHIKVLDAYNAAVIFDEVLSPGTEYTVSFSDSILSDSAMALEPYSVSFTTVQALPPPRIISTSPADGDVDVPVSTQVSVVFDMDIQPDTLTEETVTVSPAVGYSIEGTADGFTLSFDEDLAYETEYTVSLSNGIQSVYGTALQAEEIRFTTVPPVENLIENGFFDDHEDLSMFGDAAGNTAIRYVQEDGRWMLRWRPGWADAPVLQKYDFSAGHRYYLSARVKSDTAQQISFTVYYETQNGESSMYHGVAKTSVNAGEWTTVSATYTIPEDYISERDPSIRLISHSAGSDILISAWEMYDMTIAESGAAKVVSCNPDNHTEELSPEDMQMTITFDKPMLPSSIAKENISSSPSAIESVSLGRDLKTCTILFQPLKVNQQYTVTVTSGVKTLYGDEAEACTLDFSTYTVTEAPMSVLSTTPADGAENTNISNMTMKVTFDTYPDASTLTKETILMSPDAIQEICLDAEDPKSAVIVFDTAGLQASTGYEIVFTPKILSMTGYPLEETAVTFTTKSVEYIIGLFRAAADSQDADLMESFMREQFGDLKISCDLYDYLRQKDSPLLEGMYQMLLNSPADTAQEIGEAVTAAAVFTIADKATQTEDVEALINSAALGIAEGGSGETYKNILDDTGRESVRRAVMANDFSEADDVGTFVTEQLILTALSRANGWENVKTILYLNKEAFTGSVDITGLLADIDALSAPSAVYRKLQNLQSDSLREVYDALRQAYNDAKSGRGGGVFGGSGGSGGGSSGNRTGGLSEYVPKVEPVEELQREEEPVFFDLDSVPWAEESILNLYDNGIVSGKAEGEFVPNDGVTREEFVKMLVLTADAYDADARAAFSDVPADSWAYPFIASAAESGLVLGISEELFGMGQYITREDVAVLVYRFAAETGAAAAGEEAAFADAADIADYAKEAVGFLHSAGIMIGDENGNFNPKAQLTRAEAAVIMDRVLQML